MGVSWGAAVVALAAVGLMGFAIQRGGTCTVAAVDEMLTQRRAHRMAAMLEASLWVAGGLALAQLAQWPGSMPADHAVTAATVLGGVLLGLGAWLNGACVFGAIARLGSGQWAQALTPVGFYLGSLAGGALMQPLAKSVARWVTRSVEQPVVQPVVQAASDSPWWTGMPWLAAAFVFYALWRVGRPLLRHSLAQRPAGAPRVHTVARRVLPLVWAPHAATIVIGATFVLTLLLAGAWAYTDVIAGWARAMQVGSLNMLGLPAALLVALFAGALLGGWTAGRWSPAVPGAAQMLRAFAGGALMGCGSLLIPGSNDGLIFIGLPLLRPYAWLAFASMAAAIAVALVAQQAWVSRSKAGA